MLHALMSRILVAICAFALFAGTGHAMVKVGVSVLPQVEIARSIGGERINVQAILEQGDSCGVFEARPSQLAWLANADIFFRIGLAWEDSMLPRIQQAVPSLKVIDLREGLELHRIQYQHGDHVHTLWDPHTWLDPVLVDAMARRIANELTRLDPDGSEYYAQRYQEFSQNLSRLDENLKNQMQSFGEKIFFVYHPAFGYFAERYGLVQVAIQDQGKEPTPRQMRQLLQFARENQVATIFVQPQENRQHAEIIARSIGAQIVDLDPLAPAWYENMLTMGEKIHNAFSQTQP